MMSLRGAFFATKQSPVMRRLLRRYAARSDMKCVQANKLLIEIYEGKIKQVIARVWEG